MIGSFFKRKINLLSWSLIMLVFIMACAQTPNKRGGYRLDKEEIIELIIDHQVAKAAAYKYPLDLRDSISEVYHQQIFTIHHLDRFDFEHDIQKLEKDPEYYKEIYDEVNLRIKEMRDDKRTE